MTIFMEKDLQNDVFGSNFDLNQTIFDINRSIFDINGLDSNRNSRDNRSDG